MILIISVCSDMLSQLEFVKPVEDILRRIKVDFFTTHYMKLNHRDLETAEKIIICGTALKDFRYLENIDEFGWIHEFHRPVLGICAGMQILAKVFGSSLIENVRVGQSKVKTVRKNALTSKTDFYSYFLNSKTAALSNKFEVLSESGRLPCIIKQNDRDFYGCLFHPEVLNPGIIESFAKT